MTLHSIATVIVEYLSTRPLGSVVSVCSALEKIYGLEYLSDGNYCIAYTQIDVSQFFNLVDTILQIATEQNIHLDALHNASIPTGLPFHHFYVISETSKNRIVCQPHFIFSKNGRHSMTWFHLTKVVFSMEYGDPSLPKLADLVSDAPDPCKDLILDYLGMNCIAACPGMLDDVITPDEIIGCGHLYADDKYYWTDCFANYVRKYNIPVPSEFRAHILKNYKVRKSKHVKHRLLRSIQITNRPRPDCFYTIHIHQDGSVQYATTSAFIEESHFTINPEDADYIVHPITETFFCYDEGTAGEAVQNGYWWKMSFFNGKGLVHTIEGFPGEADWRYTNFRELLEFVEWQTGKDLGSKFMDK